MLGECLLTGLSLEAAWAKAVAGIRVLVAGGVSAVGKATAAGGEVWACGWLADCRDQRTLLIEGILASIVVLRLEAVICSKWSCSGSGHSRDAVGCAVDGSSEGVWACGWLADCRDQRTLLIEGILASIVVFRLEGGFGCFSTDWGALRSLSDNGAYNSGLVMVSLLASILMLAACTVGQSNCIEFAGKILGGLCRLSASRLRKLCISLTKNFV